MMNKKERLFLLSVLAFIIIVVASDVFSDSQEGAKWWHLISEGLIGVLAAFGIAFILRNSIQTKHILESERIEFSEYKIQATKWKEQHKKFLNGLSLAIDEQLNLWKLTSSEKEVALLLLKGLSLKEIADIRNTSEKTCRAQSTAIYSKSKLAGRSELAAFFLEDLLQPQSQEVLPDQSSNV